MTVKAWKVIGRCLLVLLCVVLVIAIVGAAQFFHRSDPKNVKRYDTDNPFITGETAISAHRSGAGDYPEETLAAFRGCVENPDFAVDYFEFDLHMTADDILVLSHDATLDRVSDAPAVFGAENVLDGEAVPDELRILSLDEVLDYLTAAGEFRYIIEIKDGGETGLAAADQLYATLKERGLLDRVIIGSFRDEVAAYITANYPDTHRSASPEEVVQFYFAALTGKKDFTCSYDVLQLPFSDARESYGLNLGTTTIINFAHAHDLAMQYWTVNDEADLAYLASVGADALITDYPDRAAAVLQGMG